MTHGVGLIIGSANSRLGLEIVSRSPTKTPFGEPSSPILSAEIGEHRVACIARHGEEHSILPHEINYRANVWALFEHGVRCCLAINTVGTIDAGFPPGELALPEQLIDYTWGRKQTFHDGDDCNVVHVDFTQPFDPVLRGRIADGIAGVGYTLRGGVYGATQGPRLETAAEIDRLERDGCTMVGMTAMPEAVLAREIGMDYAICALGVNHGAGRGAASLDIHSQLERFAAEAMNRAATVLGRVVPDLCSGQV